jgi:hypothetical protein
VKPFWNEVSIHEDLVEKVLMILRNREENGPDRAVEGHLKSS